MKKKLITLLLSVVMVFYMAVPSFATSGGYWHRAPHPTYCVLGDSIGAGFGFAQYENYCKLVPPYSGGKNYTFAVPEAFPTKVVAGIDANKTSINGTYPAFRAKEICYLLGMGDIDYSNEYFDDLFFRDLAKLKGRIAMGETRRSIDIMLEKDSDKVLASAISDADVINVQLGLNDLNSLVINIVFNEDLCKAIKEAIDGTQDEDLKKSLDNVFKGLGELKENMNNNEFDKDDMKKWYSDATRVYYELNNIDPEVKHNILDVLTSIIVQSRTESVEYYSKLLSYIHTNKKADAIVVVNNVYNPIAGIKIPVGKETLDAGAIIQPLINSINNNIISGAAHYGYTLVDISDITVDPMKIQFIMHPDAAGHDVIASRILNTLDRLTAPVQPTTCQHKNTELVNAKEATYLEKGYTGDTVCKDCKAVVTKGTGIAKLKPAKTSIKSLTKGKKSFTVKWAKKSNINGYQIQYATKSNFSNAKKVTVKSATAVKKTVKNLKAKKKYYVRVRTFKTVEGTNCYSAWSAKKSVTTK